MDEYLRNLNECVYSININDTAHCRSSAVISETIDLSKKYEEPIGLTLTSSDGLGIAVLNLDRIGMRTLRERFGIEQLVESEDAKLCNLCDKRRF